MIPFVRDSSRMIRSSTMNNFKFKMNPDVAIEVPDGGYGWVIVVAVFFVHVFVLGNFYSFGVFFPFYITEFNSDQSSVAWIGSIGSGLMTGLAVYTGAWADEFGNNKLVFTGGLLIGAGYLLASFSTEIWHLYLTQGLIAGVGYSCAFLGGVSVVGQWFTTNRGLAVGIAVAGSGLGQFAIALITGYLLLNFGFRTTLRYLALINCAGLTICSLFIRRTLPCYKRPPGETSIGYFEDRNFLLLFISGFVGTLGIFMPFTHLPQYAILHGVSTSNAIFLLSIMGIFSAAGRIFLGIAADHFGKVMALRLCNLGGAITGFCWLSCTDFNSLIAFAAFFGFFAGGFISIIPPVCAHLFGVNKLGNVLGLMYSSSCVGNLLSAPIGGYLYDAYGNYTVAIILISSFLMVGFLFSIFVSDDPILDSIFFRNDKVVNVTEFEKIEKGNDESTKKNINGDEDIELVKIYDGIVEIPDTMQSQKDSNKYKQINRDEKVSEQTV